MGSNRSRAGGVLANDFDPDGDALSALLVSPPQYGTLTLNPDGSFQYVPSAGFSGMDTFKYQVSDGAATDMANVMVAVQNGMPMPTVELKLQSFVVGRDKVANPVGTATHPGSLEGKDVVFSVTVSLPQGVNALTQPVQVSYSTFDATDMKDAARHVAGTKPSEAQDYQKTSGVLVFPAGAQGAALTQTITVKTIADETVEEDEPFYLEVVGIQNAQLNGPARATGCVRNNDVDVFLVVPGGGIVTLDEGQRAKVPLLKEGLRTSMLNGLDVWIRWWTKEITATADADYDHISSTKPKSMRLTNENFGAPVEVKTIDDSLYEPTESFFIIVGVDYAKSSNDVQVDIDAPVVPVDILDGNP